MVYAARPYGSQMVLIWIAQLSDRQPDWEYNIEQVYGVKNAIVQVVADGVVGYDCF